MNQRFNELNTRLTDRDREFADHAASVDSRFTEMVTATSALKQCIAGLESIHVDPITATIEQWLLVPGSELRRPRRRLRSAHHGSGGHPHCGGQGRPRRPCRRA
jgi:hypothetical protein